MPARLFTDEWIDAVNALEAAVATPLRLNVSIVDAAHPDGRIDASVDTTTGRLIVTRATIAAADVHVATDDDTAVAIIRSAEATAARDAFLAGRILAQGSVMPLIVLGREILGGPVAAQVAAITA